MDGRIQFTVQFALELMAQGDGHHLTLAPLAHRVGLSPSRCAYLFKLEMGQSYQSFAHDLRMKQAKDLLSNPRHGIKEIACRVGFSQAHNFARAFKTHFGQSPSEYRRTLPVRAEP